MSWELETRLAALAARVCKLEGRKASKPMPEEEYRPPAESPIGQSIERLAAYFDKRARENEKRAKDLEKEIANEFNPWDNYQQKDRSSYFLSGKADAYKRAAEKLRGLLGESEYHYPEYDGYSKWAATLTPDEPEYPAMFGGKPPSGRTATGAVMMAPKPAAYFMYTPTTEESKVWKDNPKWTGPMFKKPAEYPAVSSYSQQEIAHAVSSVASASVKPVEKWVIDMKAKGYPNDPWEPSGDSDVRGEFPSKAAADAAIAKNSATMVVRRARRIE